MSVPDLAKLLYRLWESHPGPIPADLDREVVIALQPWVEQLKAMGDVREPPDLTPGR